MGRERESDWAEAKRLCRLSAEDVRKAQKLGLNPRKLVKNRPSPSQKWKLPVRDWVRELYFERHGGVDPLELGPERPQRKTRSVPLPEDDWGVPELDESWDLEDEDGFHLRRQEQFRAAADWVAVAFAGLSMVEKVALFGSVARPLEREPPRSRRLRRQGNVLHECKDVDLAVWVTDVGDLKSLQMARARAVNDLLASTGFGVAHHQVDVFLFEPGTDRYRGRLCSFGVCPKGKPECLVPGCGQALFLRQHERFALDPNALEPGCTILLFDRARRLGPPSLARWQHSDDIPF